MHVQVEVRRGRKVEKRVIEVGRAPEPRPGPTRTYVRGETVIVDRLPMPSQSSCGRHGRRPGNY